MDLIDMKLPKRTKKEMRGEVVGVPGRNEERYPYGLDLCFDNDDIMKISVLKTIKAGAKVTVQAVGKVTEVRTVDTDTPNRNDRQNVEIQIQKIAIADRAGFSEAFKEASK